MRVLFLNGSVSLGSTGKIITDIASDLIKDQDNEVKCIHGFFPNIEKGRSLFPGECIQTVSKMQYYCCNVMSKLFGRAGFFAKTETAKALTKLGDWVPDIVHLHNLHGYFMHLPTLFAYLKKINKPIIWTMHDCWPITGHCPHFMESDCQRWQTSCYSPCPERSSYPKGILKCPVERNFKEKEELYEGVKDNLTFVTPSEWLANIVKESPIVKCPTLVIHNGIDLSSFKPTDRNFKKTHNLEAARLILGVASPWSEKKGLNEFVKLANDLPEPYKLIMVGIDEELSKQIPEKIIKIAHTDSKEELADIYSSADLFLMPTYADNYPTVCLEAQACGTPVLAYDAGGTKETLLKGYSSYVDKGDYKTLLNAILNFVPTRIPPEKAYSFSYKRMAEEYIHLYRNQLANKAMQEFLAPPQTK